MGKKLQITIDNQVYDVQVGDLTGSPIEVTVNGVVKRVAWQEVAAAPAADTQPAAPQPVATPGPVDEPPHEKPLTGPTPVAAAVGGTPVRAPMPGKILSVRVKEGDMVTEGQTICTLEAMKMEMPISSTASGKVVAVPIAVGSNVAYDDALIVIG
jgi:biotin carboxyl carrier protein